MKKIIIFVLPIVINFNAKAQIIIGSYWTGQQEIFTSLDIASGVFTDLGTLNGVNFLNGGEATFDPFNNRYYNITNLGITIIDGANGNIISTIPNSKNMKGIEYNPTTNKLIGSYWNGQQEIFTSLDITSGAFYDLSTLYGVNFLNGGETTLYSLNNWYINITDFGITVIDAISGNIINTIPNLKNMKGIQYNTTTNKLIGSYWTGQQEIFTSLDIASGVFTDLGTLNGVNFLNGGEATFDPFNNRYYNITDLGITIIDGTDGNIIKTIPNQKNMKGITAQYKRSFLSISEISNIDLVSVYPNPATSNIYIKIATNLLGSDYSVYNNVGKLVLAGKLNTENTMIELNNLSDGIYLIKVGDNLKQIIKVIKK